MFIWSLTYDQQCVFTQYHSNIFLRVLPTRWRAKNGGHRYETKLRHCHTMYIFNKSAFSFVRQLTTWHCTHALLRAVMRHGCCWPPAVQQSINNSCPPPGPQQQTRRKARACGGRMLGQANDDNDNDFIGMAANRLD